MYPFIWLPAKQINHTQYDILYALQAGIGILIGAYVIGWLADKIGRRPALIMSAVLGGIFIWPFAYVTNFSALFVLSIADTFGFAGFLAVSIVYMSDIMGTNVRSKVIMITQGFADFMLLVVLTGIIPHYWFPVHYRAYLWLLAGLNLAAGVALCFRMPESPRWLEARGRHDDARKVVERIEARVMKRHAVLPEPDLTAHHQVVAQEKTSMFAVFGRQYIFATVLLLVVMVLGYAGILYGGTSQAFLFLGENRHYSPGFIFALTAWSGVAGTVVYVLNAFIGDRFERIYIQLVGAMVYAGAWWGIYAVHDTPALSVLYCVQEAGLVLWLWNMYIYIPTNFPTRMRSLGTGWTDGVGHLGAWGGTVGAGAIFSATAPLNFIVFITVPGALLPAILVAIFGKRQGKRTLEDLAR
jgi:putative MFS transporter